MEPHPHTPAREAYLEFLGLQRNPFPVVPDAENFYQSSRIDVLITEIMHGITTRKGFMVITGEVGLGKTTVSRKLLKNLDKHGIATALVFHTFIQHQDLLAAINKDFGVEVAASAPLQEQLEALNRFLMATHGAGGNSAILIDDAQNLSAESLELLRLISNLETNTDKLVQILLVGQPELLDKLNDHSLRQLKSRVVIHARVQPLDHDDVRQYVTFKLNTAGASGNIQIPERVFRAIHARTQGNPRHINILMDRCLYALFADNTRRLSVKQVEEAAREVGLDRGAVVSKGSPWPMAAALTAVVALAAAGGWWWLGPARVGDFAAPLLASTPTTESVARELAALQQARMRAEEEARKAESLRQTAETEAAKARETLMQAQAEATRLHQALRQAQVVEPVKASAVTPSPALPEGITPFLAGHGLSEYEEPFRAALRDNRLAPLAEEVRRHTGLALVRLSSAGADISGALSLATGEVLLFWRPPYWLDDFPYTASRDAVRSLQGRLAELGYYEGRVDGLIGKMTLMGLMRMQQDVGIAVTGQPDATTLYLLHQGGERARWVVQAGSYQDAAKAGDVEQRLRKAGLPAYVQRVVAREGDNAWYVVRVGPYARHEQAEEVVSQLQARHETMAMVKEFVAPGVGKQ